MTARAAAAALCVTLAACAEATPFVERIDATDEIQAEADVAAEWVRASRSGEPLSDSRILGVGYLERGRLGLGSPFRLADFALSDPRLAEADRAPVAAWLLRSLLRGELYVIDPRVLDGAELLGEVAGRRPGREHFGLIDRTIREAEDPRAGELAVRIAYTLAGAEGVVRRSGVRTAVRVAALLRDRELARRDAVALIRRAEREGASAVSALPAWRAQGGPRVEAPLSAPLPPALEEEGLALARLTTEAVRNLAAPAATRGPAAERPPRSLLGMRAAARLAALAADDAAPPRPAISVALQAHRPILESGVALSPRGRAASSRFLRGASNEEALAAELSLLNARTEDHPVGYSVALWAAVGLRPFAQERPWFPGFPAPSLTELTERHGITQVTFDASIPDPWRPFYLAVLDVAVRDLRRVMPTLQLRGLRVHVGSEREGPGPLALHDPGDRRLFLPPSTAAGTLAHEIAHDLDWQVALRRYRVRGDYGTDRAFRARSDPLSTWVRGLAAAAPGGDGRTALDSHWTRPAEVFARGIDWFSVVSLGHQGRMNGYLSSVQDDVLTGYGTVPAPDATGAAGGALIAILDDVAPAYPATREWFLSAYGPARTHTALDLLRLVLAEGLPSSSQDDGGAPFGPRRLRAALQGYDIAAAALETWACRSPGSAYGGVRADARHGLIAEAARAVTRGLAMERADALAGLSGTRWLARRLYGRRWREESVPEDARSALEELLRELRDAEGQVPALEPGGGLRLNPSPARCGGTAIF
ncbi:MAG TPA: hypothetical protein VML95_11150 [Longimicrobiales bacterium]|nr:hypothetical protein [Longimicrobiales bacterium]